MAIEKVKPSQSQPKTAIDPLEGLATQKSITSINDYLDLRIESNLKKLMDKNQEDLTRTSIFSDYVTRINSNSERKLRVLVITSRQF